MGQTASAKTMLIATNNAAYHRIPSRASVARRPPGFTRSEPRSGWNQVQAQKITQGKKNRRPGDRSKDGSRLRHEVAESEQDHENRHRGQRERNAL